MKRLILLVCLMLMVGDVMAQSASGVPGAVATPAYATSMGGADQDGKLRRIATDELGQVIISTKPARPSASLTPTPTWNATTTPTQPATATPTGSPTPISARIAQAAPTVEVASISSTSSPTPSVKASPGPGLHWECVYQTKGVGTGPSAWAFNTTWVVEQPPYGCESSKFEAATNVAVTLSAAPMALATPSGIGLQRIRMKWYKVQDGFTVAR